MAQVLTNQKRCQLSPGAGFLDAPPGPGASPLVARLWNSLKRSQQRHWLGEGEDWWESLGLSEKQLFTT